jgi:hypothetical protein
MIQQKEGVAGNVAPADGVFRGAGREPAPTSCLPVEYAPLRRKVQRAVRSPSFTAHFLGSGRVGRSPCVSMPPAPW